MATFIKINLFILLSCIASSLYGQSELQSKFEVIADSTKGRLGVSVLQIESGTSVSFNGSERFPMQSVYKFPIAMVMLHQIDAGLFSLEDSITIDKNEYIPKLGHSPLRERYPDGVTLSLKDVIEYNVSQSDGTACDVLIRLLGGTEKVQESIHNSGVRAIAIATTEMVQVANDTIQYQNWSTPDAMNELLRIFYNGTYLSESSTVLLNSYMSISNQWFDRRIKGLLPKETKLAHKTGSSRTFDGLTRATNDAGIITLPDGSHLAISVFVADSYDSQEKRELAIAKVAKAAYDFWTSGKE